MLCSYSLLQGIMGDGGRGQASFCKSDQSARPPACMAVLLSPLPPRLFLIPSLRPPDPPTGVCTPGFDCRCGHLFCAAHRYSDKHECPFDYRGEAAARLRKENPIVVAEKIQKL